MRSESYRREDYIGRVYRMGDCIIKRTVQCEELYGEDCTVRWAIH